MRWEDGGYSSLGVPARVVQYEGSFENLIQVILQQFCMMILYKGEPVIVLA